MAVAAVTDLLPRMRRLTFTAEEFGRYAPAGPDECFGLLAPGQGRTHLRWYTVRAHRRELAEIDVDVVLHEHAGPAVRWSAAASVGSTIDFRRSGASYTPPQPCSAQLLLADETALPALAAIVESLPSPDGVRAVVELPDASWTYDVGGAVAVDWRHRGSAPPGSCLADVVAGDPYPLDYAWVCGEAAGVKAVRRALIGSWGLGRRRITFSGYWRAG